MTRKLIPIAAAVVLLPLSFLALMIAGCQQATETTEPAAPQTEATEAAPAQVDALVRSYLDLRQLLAADKYEGVPEQLAEIRHAAQPLAESDNVRVEAHARAIVERATAEPDNLKQAREVFKGISTAMIELVKVAPPSDSVAKALYVAYCPMAKASWLQATEELANPYMGQKMLTCGEVKETIPKTST